MRKLFILFLIPFHLIVMNSCDRPGEFPDDNKPETDNPGNNDSLSSSKQCIAITQSGTQCKRKAAAGSNYCWQHK